MERDTLDLTGLWRFQPDPYDEGEKVGYHLPEHDDRFWREVQVPCSFDQTLPGLETYEGAGWYRRTVEVPEAWSGQRVLLRFEGINNRSRVWVNGVLAGGGDDPFLPVEHAVQRLLRPGQTNLLVVRADTTRRKGDVPGLQRGWRPRGGILRECRLTATDPLCIAAAWVTAEPSEGGRGRLNLVAQVLNGRDEGQDVVLRLDLSDGAGRTLGSFSTEPARLPAGADLELPLDAVVEGVEPWSPANPNLCTGRLSLRVGGEVADETDVRFGFRSIRAEGGRLLLNGSPIFLTGFNRHEDSPRTGMCPDLDLARRDLESMKRLGANFVRLCHYPHHPAELDLCDELGLLALCEIPLYWWNGLEEGEEACERKLAAARRQVREMIRRDRSHPSVILWSVSNETQEARPEVASGNAELVDLAKTLDGSRLAAHVSDKWTRERHFDSDDVLCVNAYPSWGGRCWEGNPGYDVAESARWWRRELAELHERYPHKPILVTEFGCPGILGLRGDALGEHVQARAIEAELAALDLPYVCGATLWCYADHPWPEEDFIRYVTTSPFGVVTRERVPKPSYSVVGRLFRQRQGLPDPETYQPDPESDDFPVRMIRPHMRDIPQHPMPEGFSLRPMRPGEAALWADVQRDAEPLIDITDDLFHREFGDDLPATLRRCFFVVDSKGSAVATVSGWYTRDLRGEDYGRIHWVATRRAYQGRGLQKAAMTHVMNCLAGWHQRCWLGTSTSRLPAIRMYLNFGFLPDLEPPGSLAAWRKVRRELRHPVLEAIPELDG